MNSQQMPIHRDKTRHWRRTAIGLAAPWQNSFPFSGNSL